MTTFPSGPYSVQIPYIVSGLTHRLELNCNVIGAAPVGSAPAAIQLESQSDIGVNLAVGVNAFWNLIRVFYPATTLASTYTLWKHNPQNTERLYISAGSLTTPNGSSANPNILAFQTIFTWRTGKGNVAKIQLMEAHFNLSTRLPLPSTGDAQINALNAYILGNDNWVMARDRSFPVAAMNVSHGQNEKLHRRRNRS